MVSPVFGELSRLTGSGWSRTSPSPDEATNLTLTHP
jgi:hypothetical protein